jgi:polysaccharide transporter, PST family
MNACWIKYLPFFIRAKLEGRYNLQSILGNSGWLFGDRLFRMGVGLFVGLWTARYLGPDSFGQLNYALAIGSLFGAVATLGTDGIIVRELVCCPTQKNEILGSAFLVRIGAGFFACFLAIITVFILKKTDPDVFFMVVIVSFSLIFQSFDAIDLWFQSQVRSKYSVLAKNLAFAFSATIKITMILVGADVLAFAWISLLEVVIGAWGLLIAYRLTGGAVALWMVTKSWIRKIILNSLPLLLSALTVMLYMRLDLIMLHEFIGAKAVGIYAAATKISEILYFFPTVIVASVAPSIIKMRTESMCKYHRNLNKMYSLLVWLAIFVSLPLSILSSGIVSVLYGEEFSASGPVLAIHIWTSIAVFLGVASGQFLLAENLQKFSFYRTMIGMVANFFLNIIFIPLFGPVGAAVATLVSYYVSVFSLLLFNETRVHAVSLLSAFNPLRMVGDKP